MLTCNANSRGAFCIVQRPLGEDREIHGEGIIARAEESVEAFRETSRQMPWNAVDPSRLKYRQSIFPGPLFQLARRYPVLESLVALSEAQCLSDHQEPFPPPARDRNDQSSARSQMLRHLCESACGIGSVLDHFA